MGNIELAEHREEIIKAKEVIESKVKEVMSLFKEFEYRFPLSNGKYWALDNDNSIRVFTEECNKQEYFN